MQARNATQIAMEASEHALAQAAQLKVEQDKASQQMTDVLSAQAEDAQKKIQSVTKVVMQTQQEVRTLFALARTTALTTKMAAEKVERQVETIAQKIQE